MDPENQPFLSFNAVLSRKNFTFQKQGAFVKEMTIFGDSVDEICDVIWEETLPFIIRRAVVQDQSAWWEEQKELTRDDLDSFVTLSDRGSKKCHIPSKLTEGIINSFSNRKIQIYIHNFSINIDSKEKFNVLQAVLLGSDAKSKFEDITNHIPVEKKVKLKDQDVPGFMKSKYCRICLEKTKNSKIKITSEIQGEFIFVTNSEFDKTLELSQILCADCHICLKNCFKFKSICLENQKKLLEIVNRFKDEKTPENQTLEEKPVLPDPPLNILTNDPLKVEDASEIATVIIKEEEMMDQDVKYEQEIQSNLHKTRIQTTTPKEEIIIEVEDDEKREDLIQYYLNLALKSEPGTSSVSKPSPPEGESSKSIKSQFPVKHIETTNQLVNPPKRAKTISKLSQKEQIKRIMEFSMPSINKKIENSKKRKKKSFSGNKKKLVKLSEPRIIEEEEKYEKKMEESSPENEGSTKESAWITEENCYINCPICFKNVKKFWLREHINHVHVKKKIYICDFCNFKTSWRPSITSHMSKHISTTNFKCDHCDKVYATQRQLGAHRRSTHEKRYDTICQVCGWIGPSLQNHLFTKHSSLENQRQFLCDLCGNGYMLKDRLKSHIKLVHRTEPEICKICGMSVKRMKGHLETHSGIFKCKCNELLEDGTPCNRTFRNNSVLNFHIQTFHRKIFSHECNRCHRTFRIKASLREHILAEHYNLQLDCLIKGCRTKFRTIRALCGHIKVVHRELSEEEKEKYRKMAKKLPTPEIVN